MSANNYQFVQTRKMFLDYLSGYPEHPTYDEWKNADAEDQVALLYVHFYQEITLAWYTAITSRDIAYVTQEDGVSTVLQYLTKNAEILKAQPKCYTGKYIYRVAYNCIGCLPRLVASQNWNEVIPNEYTEDDIEVNLWDLVPTTDEDLETQELKSSIWEIIHRMGPKAEKVADYLINGSGKMTYLPKDARANKLDRLAEISVSESEYADIIAEFKLILAPVLGSLYR